MQNLLQPLKFDEIGWREIMKCFYMKQNLPEYSAYSALGTAVLGEDVALNVH